jgi:hypothetical protein
MDARATVDASWDPKDYADQACKVATHRVEESTRYGDTLNLVAEPTLVKLERFAVDVFRRVGVRVERRQLPGRDGRGTDVLVAASETAAREALAGDVEALPTRADTLEAIRAAATRAPYAEIQEGRYLGTRSRDVRWQHHCEQCNGRGDVSCSGCGGSGRTSCTHCGGSGSETHWTTDHDGHSRSETRSCTWCFAGRVTCTSCGGSGREDCRPCAATGWQTESSTAKAIVRESRQAAARWADPQIARVVGGTIPLDRIGDDELAVLVGQEPPVFQGASVTRRFHFALPIAAIELTLGALRKPVYVVGRRPRLQLAEAFLDEVLKGDVDEIVRVATTLGWRAPWNIFGVGPAWVSLRENEVLEALLTAAAQGAGTKPSSWASVNWAWRSGAPAFDRNKLHAAIDGGVSVQTIERTLAAADRVIRFSRYWARGAAAAGMAGFVALGVRYGESLGLGGLSTALTGLASAWALAELVGWWLARPLGPLARAR